MNIFYPIIIFSNEINDRTVMKNISCKKCAVRAKISINRDAILFR